MRLLVSAAVLTALLAPTAVARAEILSGTWDFSASGWTSSPPFPSGTTTGSASFSFDDSASTSAILNPSQYSDNFGATDAAYQYNHPTDALTVEFGKTLFCCADRGDTHYILSATFHGASTVPAVTEADWFDADGPSGRTTDVSAGFIPAASLVPEPSTLAILLAGIASLAFALRRRLRGGSLYSAAKATS
jgi:PEP-CTERM motif